MRIKTAVPILVAGLLLMLLGIGQQTLWAPAETITASLAEGAEPAPVTVIRPQELGSTGDSTELTVEADGPFTLAVGRSSDVAAWVGDAAHLSVTGISDGALTAERTDGDDSVPDPRGSDLWVNEEPGDGTLTYRWSAPAEGDWSILLAADGAGTAPSQVSVVVPNDRSTPFALPLIISGALVVVLGIALLFLAPRKRSDGRHDGHAGTGTGTETGTATGAALYGGPQPESPTSRGTSSSFAVPGSILVVAGLVGAGSLLVAAPGLATTTTPSPAAPTTATALPTASVTASATPTATATASATAPTTAVATGAPSAGSPASGPPVVLDTQLERILRAVADAVADADAAADEEILTERVGGAALDLRAGAYAVRAKDDDAVAPAPVAAAPLLLDMIPTSEEWPRSVVALTQGDEDPVPQALLLVQESPRENYRLMSAVQMLPGSTFPSPAVAGATGPVSLDDVGALKTSPQDAVASIADLLTTPTGSNAETFEDNSFAEAITDFQADVIADPGNRAATITFTHTPETDHTEALMTGDGGAMVFGYLDHTYSSVPRAPGDTIDLTGTVYEALTGQGTSGSGIDVGYGEAVMMYVPPAGSDAEIRVVGATQQLLSATLR